MRPRGGGRGGRERSASSRSGAPEADAAVAKGHREVIPLSEEGEADEALRGGTGEGGDRLARLEVPELDLVLLGDAREVRPVGEEAEGSGRLAVTRDQYGLLPGRQVEEADRSVLAGHRDVQRSEARRV